MEPWRQHAALSLLSAAAAGIGLALPHLHPLTCPLHLLAFLPLLLCMVSPAFPLLRSLPAGALLGLSYSIPLVIHVGLPLSIGATMIVYTTALFVVFALCASVLMRRPGILSSLGLGALLALFDFVNFTALPIWGTAQSFFRPWSNFPACVRFVSVTGITAIPFFIGSFQGILAPLIVRRLGAKRAAAATGLLVIPFLVFQGMACSAVPSGSMCVAALGWSRESIERAGPVERREGFEALFASPVREAAERGARLVVSPEMGFEAPEGWAGAAWLPWMSELAGRYGVTLSVGVFDRSAMKNLLLFIDDRGRVASSYHKTHLTPFEHYPEGPGIPTTIAADRWRVGGIICQDDNFTDLTRALGRSGVSLVAIPTYDWHAVKDAHLENTRFRALESGFGIVRGAQNGISAVISPAGEVLAMRDHILEGEGWIRADLPLLEGAATPFSRWGHWPIPLYAALILSGFVMGIRSRRREEEAS